MDAAKSKVRGALAKREELNLWQYYVDADDFKYDVRFHPKLWTPTRFFRLLDSSGTQSVTASHQGADTFIIEAGGHIHGGEHCTVTYVFDRSLKLSTGEKTRLASLLKTCYQGATSSEKDAARRVAATLGVRLPPW